MNVEELFHRLLGLGKSWEVVGCEYEQEANSFFVMVRETKGLWEEERCPKCSQAVRCYDHVELMSWRHLNVFNKASEILCELPRGRCVQCGHTYRVKPPWEGRSKHFTQEFEAFALTLMREMPMKKVGEIVEVDDMRLWRMLLAHVDEAHAKLEMDDVTCVGADEMNRRKGHNYLTVFCDLLKKRVLFACEGKDAKAWEAFAQCLCEHNGDPRAIRQASIDMSPAYIKGVEENCRNAEIVFDKFHVVRSACDAVDEVRRAESRLDEAKKEALKETMWLWRKNPENLSENEQRRMKRIDHVELWTSKAYQMRLALQDIYRLPYRSVVRRRLASWSRWVRRAAAQAPGQVLDAMKKVAAMIDTHLEGILAYWTAKVTNAFLEGLNSLFSATKRKARGYRTTRYLKAMLYFVAGKLSIPTIIPVH
jgi:transposase